MTKLQHFPTNVGKLLTSKHLATRHGVTVTNHHISVPVDYSAPLVGNGIQSDRLEVFVRELSTGDAKSLPALLYLQGGPGFGSPKPGLPSGWIQEALQHFRVFLLDQRGTGRSTPVTAHQAQRLSPTKLAEYLFSMRADNIVRDAEAVRQVLNIDTWYTLGQSFGGFCTLTYLSLAPEALSGCLITGGLPGLTNTADEVYRRTYPAMASRWEEYLSWYPEDQQQFNRIADLITSREVSLPGGEILSVPRLQQLGMFLGGNSRVDQLHYLLEDAILPGGNLHPGFLEQTHQTLSYAAAPLYAVLHESIYAQNSATRWAAERVRDEFDEFSSSATNIFPTGEHIQQEFFTVDPGLRPFRATAEVLAAKDDWPDLYDVRQLASNQVPVAAAIYQDDVYVPVELSRETANRVRNMHVWHSDEHHHDGLRADGQNIFSALATSIGLPGYH